MFGLEGLGSPTLETPSSLHPKPSTLYKASSTGARIQEFEKISSGKEQWVEPGEKGSRGLFTEALTPKP